MSMPSFIKDVLPNAISIQKSAGVVACSFARVSGEKKKKDVRPGFRSPLAHLHCRKGMEEQRK